MTEAPMKYLFIAEGGERIFTVNNELTDVDIACVNLGQIYVIRLSDMKELTPDGTWESISKGEINATDDPSGSFHWAND
jgi:hypothetical protein